MSFFDELHNEQEEEQQTLAYGIFLGEVTENWDKDHPGMVKVQLLLSDSEKNSLDWVPVASAYAGNQYGAYALPEIGMQVIIAFYMGQPQSPYVIGCLWNKTNVLPTDTANENNTIKTYITKGGNAISICDETDKEKITLQTKSGQTIVIDDENKLISVKGAEDKNKIEMDSESGVITLLAENKIVMKAGDTEMLVLDGSAKKASVETDAISVKANQGLTLKGQSTTLEGSTTTIKGQNVTAEAQAALKLSGTASLKAESSGILEAKGSLMKLN